MTSRSRLSRPVNNSSHLKTKGEQIPCKPACRTGKTMCLDGSGLGKSPSSRVQERTTMPRKHVLSSHLSIPCTGFLLAVAKQMDLWFLRLGKEYNEGLGLLIRVRAKLPRFTGSQRLLCRTGRLAPKQTTDACQHQKTRTREAAMDCFFLFSSHRLNHFALRRK